MYWKLKQYIKQCYGIVWSVKKIQKVKNSKFWKTKNGRVTLFLKCAIHDNKKSRFTKDHEASGLLSVLKIKTTLIRIPLVGPMLL